MEYKILASGSYFDLGDIVNSYIEDGWRPQGGVSMYECAGGTRGWDAVKVTFYQAMIRKPSVYKRIKAKFTLKRKA